MIYNDDPIVLEHPVVRKLRKMEIPVGEPVLKTTKSKNSKIVKKRARQSHVDAKLTTLRMVAHVENAIKETKRAEHRAQIARLRDEDDIYVSPSETKQLRKLHDLAHASDKKLASQERNAARRAKHDAFDAEQSMYDYSAAIDNIRKRIEAKVAHHRARHDNMKQLVAEYEAEDAARDSYAQLRAEYDAQYGDVYPVRDWFEEEWKGYQAYYSDKLFDLYFLLNDLMISEDNQPQYFFADDRVLASRAAYTADAIEAFNMEIEAMLQKRHRVR